MKAKTRGTLGECLGPNAPKSRRPLFGSEVASPTAPPNGDEDPPANPQIETNDKHDESQRELTPGASSPARPEVDAASEPPKREDKDDPFKKFTVGGYVEAFYQWNFNRPTNNISNYRGYDVRHNTFRFKMP